MEWLEAGVVLAKQVLSQLSYTPTVGTTFILRHLREFQKPFLCFSMAVWKTVSRGLAGQFLPTTQQANGFLRRS
jgi:hypothetical protein